MDYITTPSVWVTTEFVALHRFPNASEVFPDRGYLEHPHRHKFFVRAEVDVTGYNRDIEYHEFKDLLDGHIGLWIAGGNFAQEQSCEMIAQQLLRWVMEAYPGHVRYSVSVAEDNENGSTVVAQA